MSTKKRYSSTPKKFVDLWYKCEKCGIHLSNSDLQEHKTHCGNLTSQNIIHTFFLPKEICCKTIDVIPVPADLSSFNKSFVFVPETVLRISVFELGQNVQLVFKDQKMVPVVRTVWISGNDKAIAIGQEDYDLNGSSLSLENVRILPLPKEATQIDTVILSLIDGESISSIQLKDIEIAVRRTMLDNLFCIGSKINFSFLGKVFNLIISEIKSMDKPKCLSDQLQTLSLSDVRTYFFKFSWESKINIILPETPESKSTEPPQKKLATIGGLDDVIEEIIKMIKPIIIPNKRKETGIRNERKGVLLHGPSGCGKTLLCDALAEHPNLKGVALTRIVPSTIFGKYLGESDSNLNRHFKTALRSFPTPTVLIIDDIQILCRKNDNSDINRRITNTLLNCLDEIGSAKEGAHIFVIATTCKVDDLDPSVLRSGRIDFVLEVPIPSPVARLEIIERNLVNVGHSLTKEEIKSVANTAHGYSGADLISLIAKATSMKKHKLTLSGINHALTLVKPSAMREIQVEVPSVKWEDIGGQHDLKLKLQQSVDWPIRNPEVFKRFGIKPPKGVLMYGPPGCSKTMIARALATESSFNFLSIKGSELFSMWVGESERAVKELFRKARAVSPSIVFFDEMDAIGGERALQGGGGSSVNERVLAQLLMEMDGITTLSNVTIIGATNRPDLIDKALIRPGRIDRIIYVGLPDEQTRKEIFTIRFKKMPVSMDVDLDKLVNSTDGYSGAELNAVCHEAALNVLEEDINALEIQWKHFEYALQMVKPRTSQDLLNLYDNYEKQYKDMK